MNVKIKRINENAEIPTYATKGSAGCDVYAPETIRLLPDHIELVPLGFKVEIPEGYELQVRPRSGLALKNGLQVVNSPGTIDADYRGEVGVILKAPYGMDIEQGTRIAQLVLKKVERATGVEDFGAFSYEVSNTERGEGGFGHTG